MLIPKDPLYRAITLKAGAAAAPTKSKPASVNPSRNHLACHWRSDSDGALTMSWSGDLDEFKALPEFQLASPLDASLTVFTPIDRPVPSLQPENPVRVLARHFAIAMLLVAAALGTLACFLLEPSMPFI